MYSEAMNITQFREVESYKICSYFLEVCFYAAFPVCCLFMLLHIVQTLSLPILLAFAHDFVTNKVKAVKH